MIKVISEFDNKLYSRKEVVLEVGSQSVPSKEEAREIVCKQFSCEGDLVRILDVKGKFGVRFFTVRADIYSSKEEFDRIVKKTKQEVEAERKAEEEKAKAEEEARKKAEEEKKEEENKGKSEEEFKEEKKEEAKE